jgi:hypothetical protein
VLRALQYRRLTAVDEEARTRLPQTWQLIILL